MCLRAVAAVLWQVPLSATVCLRAVEALLWQWCRAAKHRRAAAGGAASRRQQVQHRVHCEARCVPILAAAGTMRMSRAVGRLIARMVAYQWWLTKNAEWWRDPKRLPVCQERPLRLLRLYTPKQ